MVFSTQRRRILPRSLHIREQLPRLSGSDPGLDGQRAAWVESAPGSEPPRNPRAYLDTTIRPYRPSVGRKRWTRHCRLRDPLDEANEGGTDLQEDGQPQSRSTATGAHEAGKHRSVSWDRDRRRAQHLGTGRTLIPSVGGPALRGRFHATSGPRQRGGTAPKADDFRLRFSLTTVVLPFQDAAHQHFKHLSLISSRRPDAEWGQLPSRYWAGSRLRVDDGYSRPTGHYGTTAARRKNDGVNPPATIREDM